LDEHQTGESVVNEIKKLKARRDAMSNGSTISPQEATTNLMEASEKVLAAEQKVQELNDVFQELESATPGRKRFYELRQDNAVKEVTSNFRSNLKERGFLGTLLVDRQNKMLKMSVDPSGTSSSSSRKDRNVETLSGGEKSFAQIALLVSIWGAMQSRLLALDEL
jgi:chromosome segregation ATPase